MKSSTAVGCRRSESDRPKFALSANARNEERPAPLHVVVESVNGVRNPTRLLFFCPMVVDQIAFP